MMASNIVQVSLLFKTVVWTGTQHILGGVRHASRKTLQPAGRGPPKHYGLWVQDGKTVTNGTIVARQRTLRVCPGLNVGYSRGFLYAKVPGKVMVTTEVTNFDPNNRHVKKLSPDATVLSKKYFNVIPKPQHQRFKLIGTN